MLSQINEAAADAMLKKLNTYEGNTDDLIEYAYAVTSQYGNASAALSAAMYDIFADIEGATVPPAEMADVPTVHEVAKTVNGVLKTSQNPNEMAGAVSRLVKRTGADTTLKNAQRDHAQFAWVPSGDTCAFCITLASRGWQYMSKNALKNGHAEHIHSNCDCTYAIRFDKNTTIEGYDPKVYQDMYYGAEGKTPEQKINSMRRKFYAENKDIVGAESDKAEELISKNVSGFKDKTDEGNAIIAELYDNMRINGGFNLLPANEMLKDDNSYFVSYPPNKISDEAAAAFNKAFDNLNNKYISSIQRIEPMAAEESLLLKSVPAYVSIDYDVSNMGVLKYNPMWTANEKKLRDRVGKAVNDKYFVEVAEKDYINYVAVHESAHTLLGNLDNIPKTSLVGGDYTNQRSAQKEINAIFDEYKKDLADKKSIADRLELEALSSFDQETWDKAAKARDDYNKVFLSKYSEENAGEFMAECFVNSEIGTNPNPYASRVVGILDKYFAR